MKTRVQTAYDIERWAAIELAERILATLKVEKENVTWGNQGEMEDIKLELQHISDMIHHEGEYER